MGKKKKEHETGARHINKQLFSLSLSLSGLLCIHERACIRIWTATENLKNLGKGLQGETARNEKAPQNEKQVQE